jgi:N-acetylneuraminic acid mutarotase
MKVKLPFIILLLFTCSANAQWASRAALPGTARAKATSFTIGDKIYMMGGVDQSNFIMSDFWEYDVVNNTWTQKSNFTGPERYGAVAFVLGNTGYIALGGNDFGYLDDMWQYDPVGNTWLQRTGLPATTAQHENQRVEAFSFVINNKAYVGGGTGFVFGPNATNNYAFSDLWENSPSTNSWIQKSGFPDFLGRNMSIAVALNDKAYVGLGCDVDQTVNRKSFWEYDPSSDTWTSKADFPSDFCTDAGAFAMDSLLYVVGGVNLTPPVSLSDQVYQYDPSADTWTQLPAFNGGEIAGQFAIAAGSSAYVGSGYTGSITPRNDVWQFNSAITGVHSGSNSANQLGLYPNPASENIYIRSSEDVARIEIYDALGKLVQSERNFSQHLDVRSMNPGKYHVKFIHKNGNTSSSNLIINR